MLLGIKDLGLNKDNYHILLCLCPFLLSAFSGALFHCVIHGNVS